MSVRLPRLPDASKVVFSYPGGAALGLKEWKERAKKGRRGGGGGGGGGGDVSDGRGKSHGGRKRNG